MSELDNSQPAFPANRVSAMGQVYFQYPGLSKIEWFAGMALAGYAARPGQVITKRLVSECYDVAEEAVRHGIERNTSQKEKDNEV